MNQSFKKPKPTLESLFKESQVITGKDLIKRKQDKEKEAALFEEASDFEKRLRKPKN
jgi:hypothetical protein